jgi:malonyl-CoA/methylmalonyl-CoA synthetase
VQARPWSNHLAGSADLDLLRSGDLPTAWADAWGANPSAPLVKELGSESDGRWISAGEMGERTTALAGRLRSLGVEAGDTVLWSPDRSVAAVVSHVGALRAGVILVPLNPALTPRELAHVVADVHPAAAMVGDGKLAATLAGLGLAVVFDHELGVLERGSGAAGAGASVAGAPGAGGGAALVCYTSGTTGAPKGAVLSHANLLANSRALIAAWRWESGDRLVHVLPLFHGHGLCAGLYSSLLAGASSVLLDGFDVDGVLQAAEAERATLFFGVPTMYHRILASGRATELSRLRLAVSGSAPLSAELHEGLATTGVDVLERYGMTETLITVSNPVEGARRAGTVGFPLPGIEAKVVAASGELLVRGPQVFAGYLGRPEQTAAAFSGDWFHTGDLAEVDDGYIRLLGRAGDLVISGGFNVYPAEVEDVLLRHPAVAEVAVAGTPSEEWGEVVTAWVVPADASFDADDLLRFAAGQLAPYKRPRLVRCVESLPRSAMGKVRRSELS